MFIFLDISPLFLHFKLLRAWILCILCKQTGPLFLLDLSLFLLHVLNVTGSIFDEETPIDDEIIKSSR